MNKEIQQEAERLNKECDILHECITELYNLDANVPIIKKCLDKISKLPATFAQQKQDERMIEFADWIETLSEIDRYCTSTDKLLQKFNTEKGY